MPSSKVAKPDRSARTGSNATCRPCPVSKSAALRSRAAMEPNVWIIVGPLPRHVAMPLSRLPRGAHYRAYFRVAKGSVMNVRLKPKKRIHLSGSQGAGLSAMLPGGPSAVGNRSAKLLRDRDSVERWATPPWTDDELPCLAVDCSSRSDGPGQHQQPGLCVMRARRRHVELSPRPGPGVFDSNPAARFSAGPTRIRDPAPV